MKNLIWILCAFIVCWSTETLAKLDYDVECSSKWMTINVEMGDRISQVYLDKLKGYPACYPEVQNKKAKFRLPLDEFHKCGVARVLDKVTGRRIFYHRIVAETPDRQQMVLVKCEMGGTINGTVVRSRRQALPAGFQEPETLTISDYITARAPIPYLSLAVRQNGRIVDTTLNVEPGSPLQMDISLDEQSADTYGLLAKFLKVTDNTPRQEEIIIQNGCAVDPYIFGNFYTIDGDYLTAKFRAFKFPNTNFVLFIGTVNVCLQKCRGVPCGNGQVGYGRKKREISNVKDPNKVYEVELTAFLKVETKSELEKSFPPLKSGSLANVYEVEEGNESPRLPPYNSKNDYESSNAMAINIFSFTNVLLVILLIKML